MKGMYRRLVVVSAAPAAVGADEPKADVTVTLSDYAFALSAPLSAGTHTIRVENSGPQLHELTIERLEPGKTLADWQQWVADSMRGTPHRAGGRSHGSNQRKSRLADDYAAAGQLSAELLCARRERWNAALHAWNGAGDNC